jgi:hypothetical protein
MAKRLHKLLLWAAHFLSVFLLPGAYVFLVYREGSGNLPAYVFWTWERLTRLLLVWVPMLLVWQLWQRRWGQAVALLLLVGFDVLVMVGGYFAFFASFMTDSPT